MSNDASALSALSASAARLSGLVRGSSADQLQQQAYPTDWTIADVLSHLGSGAVISKARIDDVVAGREAAADFNQSVWDEWNAKSPQAQATDALAADAALLDRVNSLTDDERAGFHVSFGPMSLDLAGFVGMRLNEHALHTWDVEVALDPSATVPDTSTQLVIDNLQMIARFTGKPTGTTRTINVRTSNPTREFVVVLEPDSVSFATADGVQPDVELPAEAFVRLLYGRLDTDHTPPVVGDASALDELRRTFKGV
jgi:uncharacterized protein (TIGR03083 family)